MQLGAEIRAIHRRAATGTNNIVVDIEFAGDRKPEQFDVVILSCPLDLPTLTGLGLDLKAQEARLLEQVRYIEFVTTACRVEGVPAGVVGTIPLPPLLDYTGYIKIYPDSDMAIFYDLAPSQQVDPKEILARIEQQVSELPPYQGQPARMVGGHSHKSWRYFPHVSLTDFSAGFYDQLESLQGYEQTFYSSSLLAYETVGTTVAYARGLVDRYFPPLG